MAIIHTCSENIGCTFEVWDQTVSLAEWLDNCTDLAADPHWPAGKRHLTDLRTSSDVSTIYDSDLQDVSSLFSIFGDRVAGLRLAIVISESQQRSAGVFANFISSTGVTPYLAREMEDACAWLGIDCKEAETILAGLRAKIQGGPAPGLDT